MHATAILCTFYLAVNAHWTIQHLRIDWHLLHFFFSEKCACEDQHRGRAQHNTCTTPNTHSCNAAYHQLAPATDPPARVWRYKISVRCRDFSPVNIPSHIWVILLGVEVKVPTTPCPYTNPRSANRDPGAQSVLLYPLCAGPSFTPCLRSSTGCSCLLFTCFCFHLVCLIQLMKGCHGDHYRGWGYPWDTYMAGCVCRCGFSDPLLLEKIQQPGGERTCAGLMHTCGTI